MVTRTEDTTIQRDGPMGDWGAFMHSELRVDRADLASHIRQLEGERLVIAVAGAPGSGKSRLAQEICDALNAKAPASAAILPMDGFHRSNDWLDARGLRPRKGAPETFDTTGFAALLQKARMAGQPLSVPTFDRDTDAVIPAGCEIEAQTRIIITEGNYLLLNRDGWRDLFPLFDLTIRLHVPEDELRDRLTRRWKKYGLPADEITRRVEENDLPNGRILLTEGRAADLRVLDYS
ncbi:hypothetical protein ABEB22_11565 [Thioclava sp. 'Guangxiensis']|uniref:hypothetical protein n=1 Tax=Thioclava sp. 'Guangxiensis' TaxID=3149044 RepID=UPI003877CFFB